MQSGYLVGNSSLVTEMRRSSWLTRIVGSIVIIAIGGLSVTPAIAVAQQEIKEAIAEAEANEISPEAEMSQTVLSVISELEKVEAKLAAAEKAKSREAVDISDEDDALEALTDRLTELDVEVMTGFDEVGAMLEANDLPDVIVERHTQAVAKYQTELNAVLEGVQQIRETTDRKKRLSKTTEVATRLKSMKHKRSQQHFDPNEMPSRSLQPKTANKPKLTAMEFAEAYPMGDYRQLMANANNTVPTGDDAFDNPDWLSESDEVKLTQPIIDKAAELGNDPVTIYHWVRNNIQWNPNWGAKQTAQLTIELQSGNAMDIASLTIGLMRAAGIPARYVHGTIDVPEDKFRNWAGGFEDINAAIDYAASGGIPLGPVTSGGQITKVRMEHIWVEIAVDFVPSRAAVNVMPDSWIAIDPSFKQLAPIQGVDALVVSALDAEQLGQSFLDSGVIDEANGWISGLDDEFLNDSFDFVLQELNSFVDQTLPNPEVGQIIGGRIEIRQEYPQINSQLPYDRVIAAHKYGRVPAQLQQTMAFAFGADILGEPIDPISFAWADVNNKKISLVFTPATASDEAALMAMLPEGEITDISQLPTILPSYLVSVVPELQVEGEVVMSGEPMVLGEELDFRFNPTFVGFGTVPNQYHVPAGAYLGVAAFSNSISAGVLADLRDRLARTSDILQGNDESLISTLSRDDVLGDLFFANLLNYYTEYVGLSHFAATQQGAHHTLAAGIGSFGYEPKVTRLFGIVRNISTGTAIANLPVIRIVGVDSMPGATEPAIAKSDFNYALGLVSSGLEHTAFEHVAGIPTGKTSPSFSAVKALELALAEGQRVYTISLPNLADALLEINLPVEVETEIRQAVQAGKEVVTHTNVVSVPGYVGAGYIIYDPNTGDGAFKISGGINGGVVVVDWIDENSGWLSLGVFFGAFLGGPIAGIALALSLILVQATILVMVRDAQALGPCVEPIKYILAGTAIAFAIISLVVKDKAAASAIATAIANFMLKNALKTITDIPVVCDPPPLPDV